MSRYRANVFAKFILIAAICLAFGAFALSWHLDGLYYQTRPSQPQLAEGRVYATYVHHGALVYLSRSEKWALEFSSPLGFLLGVTAVVLYWRSRGESLS